MKKKATKLLFVLFFIFSLIACSNTEGKQNNDNNNVGKDTQTSNFEQNIQETLKQNNIEVDTVIDYDIKDNYIFVFYNKLGAARLSISFMKIKQDGLELVMTEDLQSETTVLGDDETPFVTIIRPEQPNIKEVRVFDEPAKFVKLYKNAGDGISLEIKYWIAYSDSEPDFTSDIKVIED